LAVASKPHFFSLGDAKANAFDAHDDYHSSTDANAAD